MPSSQIVPFSSDSSRNVNFAAPGGSSTTGEPASTGSMSSRVSAVVNHNDIIIDDLERGAVAARGGSPRGSSYVVPMSSRPEPSQPVINHDIESHSPARSLVRELLSCPLTGEVMREPVLASNGWVYERSAIVAQFEKANREGRLSTEAMELGIAALVEGYHLSELLRDFASSSDGVVGQCDEDGALDYLCCPISYETMREPVVASDGRLYDRSTLQRLVAEGKPSPYSREPLTLSALRHKPLGRAIARWHRERGETGQALKIEQLPTVAHVQLTRSTERSLTDDDGAQANADLTIAGRLCMGCCLGMCGLAAGAFVGPGAAGLGLLVGLFAGCFLVPQLIWHARLLSR